MHNHWGRFSSQNAFFRPWKIWFKMILRRLQIYFSFFSVKYCNTFILSEVHNLAESLSVADYNWFERCRLLVVLRNNVPHYILEINKIRAMAISIWNLKKPQGILQLTGWSCKRNLWIQGSCHPETSKTRCTIKIYIHIIY